MKKNLIKRFIILPATVMILTCGILVLGTSITSYISRVYDAGYEKVNTAQSDVQNLFHEMKEAQILLSVKLSANHELSDAVAQGYEEVIASFISSELLPAGLDYGYVADINGTVLARLNNNVVSTDVSGTPQFVRAMRGDMTSTIAVDRSEPLRLATCSPIYNESDDIIGMISIGRILNTREFANSIKELTELDATLFVDAVPVASTLTYPQLEDITDEYREQILEDVLIEGKPYNNILDFYEGDFISWVYPLRGITNEPVGMLFLGLNSTEAYNEIINYVIRGVVITFIFFIIAVVTTRLTAKSVINRIEAMEEHMQNRDMLFESVNKASFILLEIDETDDIRMPLVSSMEYLGLAFAVDHVHLWRYKVLDEGKNQFVREYSWVSEYAKLKAGTPKYINSSGDGVLDEWMKKFLENDIVRGIVANMEPSHQKVINTLNAKSIAMMPIYLEEQFWGMFTVDNMQHPKDYTDDEIYILRSISLMMANIVRRHDLQKENLKVYYDALTGINNRRFFDKTMARTISSLSRSGNELGLMMIDVDYFKKYNDTYGHGAGDECLIRVAEILAQSANRIDDFVARYGGEEFVAVMPNTDREGAEMVAKRMLENVRAAKIPHEASDVAEFVTVSIGITTGKVTHHHTPESFVQRADDMLYKSKHDGRNRATYGELEEAKT